MKIIARLLLIMLVLIGLGLGLAGARLLALSGSSVGES
jgi:hypothetical protein